VRHPPACAPRVIENGGDALYPQLIALSVYFMTQLDQGILAGADIPFDESSFTDRLGRMQVDISRCRRRIGLLLAMCGIGLHVVVS